MPGVCECGHALKDHCPGNSSHSYYKDAMRQIRNPRTFKCKTRHCESVLCCCTDYREANADTPREQIEVPE